MDLGTTASVDTFMSFVSTTLAVVVLPGVVRAASEFAIILLILASGVEKLSEESIPVLRFANSESSPSPSSTASSSGSSQSVLSPSSSGDMAQELLGEILPWS